MSTIVYTAAPEILTKMFAQNKIFYVRNQERRILNVYTRRKRGGSLENYMGVMIVTAYNHKKIKKPKP